MVQPFLAPCPLSCTTWHPVYHFFTWHVSSRVSRLFKPVVYHPEFVTFSYPDEHKRHLYHVFLLRRYSIRYDVIETAAVADDVFLCAHRQQYDVRHHTPRVPKPCDALCVSVCPSVCLTSCYYCCCGQHSSSNCCCCCSRCIFSVHHYWPQLSLFRTVVIKPSLSSPLPLPPSPSLPLVVLIQNCRHKSFIIDITIIIISGISCRHQMELSSETFHYYHHHHHWRQSSFFRTVVRNLSLSSPSSSPLALVVIFQNCCHKPFAVRHHCLHHHWRQSSFFKAVATNPSPSSPTLAFSHHSLELSSETFHYHRHHHHHQWR